MHHATQKHNVVCVQACILTCKHTLHLSCLSIARCQFWQGLHRIRLNGLNNYAIYSSCLAVIELPLPNQLTAREL